MKKFSQGMPCGSEKIDKQTCIKETGGGIGSQQPPWKYFLLKQLVCYEESWKNRMIFPT